MTANASTFQGRFTRNADKAFLGGVCAGIADYFGFNLRVTRLLAIIAFCVAMPVTILVYVALVLLVSAESGRYSYTVEREHRRTRRRMSRSERKQAPEYTQCATAAARDARGG
mgnify:CR=1 FL=1